VEAGFAYTGTNDIISGYAEQADIAWYPEFTAAADYTLKKYKTTFSLFWKNYGERPVYRYENNTPVQSINEGYQLLDASIRQPFLKDKLQVTAGAKNLLDVTDVRASSGSGVHSGSVAGGAPMAMGTFFFTKISFTF
jgi:outer membrane receptor for ferrienterochelin and colicins